MLTRSDIELADRTARLRPIKIAAGTTLYIIVHVLMRPLFYADGVSRSRIDWWAINTLLMLAAFATGGALVRTRRVRGLVNDEVSRAHYRTAVSIGYWIAMTVAMGIYLVPPFGRLPTPEVLFLVVTPSIVVPFLVFAYLEHRANRDA